MATRIGQRALFARGLRLQAVTLEQVWAEVEAYASDDWRSAQQLGDFLTGWLAEHDPSAGGRRLDGQQGRYYAFGHGGLIRRPAGGDWTGQQAPEYRTASVLLGDRTAVLNHPDDAVDALLLHHVQAHGPSSRHDLAWWSGLGLTTVDAALARLDLPADTGPGGRPYHDVPDAAPPAAPAGVHLLPEFDALICGYHPAGRERFVDPADYAVLWSRDNGLLLAPVLLDGRLRGHWRLVGTGARRRLQVTLFAGARPVVPDELATSAHAVEAALDVSIADVEVLLPTTQ